MTEAKCIAAQGNAGKNLGGEPAGGGVSVMDRSSSWLIMAPSQEWLFAFVTGNAEAEVVRGNQLMEVGFFQHLATGRLVDALIPIPDRLEAVEYLNGKVGTCGRPRPHWD